MRIGIFFSLIHDIYSKSLTIYISKQNVYLFKYLMKRLKNLNIDFLFFYCHMQSSFSACGIILAIHPQHLQCKYRLWGLTESKICKMRQWLISVYVWNLNQPGIDRTQQWRMADILLSASIFFSVNIIITLCNLK